MLLSCILLTFVRIICQILINKKRKRYDHIIADAHLMKEKIIEIAVYSPFPKRGRISPMKALMRVIKRHAISAFRINRRCHQPYQVI